MQCPIGCVTRCALHEPCWFRGDDDVISLLDQEQKRRRARVEDILHDVDRPDLAGDFIAKMREIDTGIDGARSTWHSITNAQRGVLLAVVGTRTGRIVRRSVKPSVYVLDGKAILLCRVATVRNLCSRELLAWDGSAFDPEQAAVMTERGRFVVMRGRQ